MCHGFMELVVQRAWGLLRVLRGFGFLRLRVCASAWPPCLAQGVLVVLHHTEGSTR